MRSCTVSGVGAEKGRQRRRDMYALVRQHMWTAVSNNAASATVGTHIGRRLECFLLPNQTVEPVHSEVWCVLQAHAAMQAGAKGVKEVDFVLQRIV